MPSQSEAKHEEVEHPLMVGRSTKETQAATPVAKLELNPTQFPGDDQNMNKTNDKNPPRKELQVRQTHDLRSSDKYEQGRPLGQQINKNSRGSMAKLVFDFRGGEMSPPRVIGLRSKSNSNLQKLYPFKTDRILTSSQILEKKPIIVPQSQGSLTERSNYAVNNFVFKGKRECSTEGANPLPQPRISNESQKKAGQKIMRRKRTPGGSMSQTIQMQPKKANVDETRGQAPNKRNAFSKINTQSLPEDIMRAERLRDSLQNQDDNPSSPGNPNDFGPRKTDSFLSESDMGDDELKILKLNTPPVDQTARLRLDSFGSKTKPEALFRQPSQDRRDSWRR